jgi:hypothetical protein
LARPRLFQLQRKSNQATDIAEIVWTPVRCLTEIGVPVSPDEADYRFSNDSPADGA